MKLTSIKVAAFVIILFFATSTKAQTHDFIVTNTGDTVACKILAPGFGSYIDRYRTADNGPAIKLDPKKVKAYYDSKYKLLRRAVYKEGKKNPEYFSFASGAIKLYEEDFQHGWVTTKFWYVSKGTDTIYQIKATLISFKSKAARMDMFGEMLKDDPAIYQEYIADNKFSMDKIKALISEYNSKHPTTN
jgi:hypothetical protein